MLEIFFIGSGPDVIIKSIQALSPKVDLKVAKTMDTFKVTPFKMAPKVAI